MHRANSTAETAGDVKLQPNQEQFGCNLTSTAVYSLHIEWPVIQNAHKQKTHSIAHLFLDTAAFPAASTR
jgi:hypothetical protein